MTSCDFDGPIFTHLTVIYERKWQKVFPLYYVKVYPFHIKSKSFIDTPNYNGNSNFPWKPP